MDELDEILQLHNHQEAFSEEYNNTKCNTWLQSILQSDLLGEFALFIQEQLDSTDQGRQTVENEDDKSLKKLPEYHEDGEKRDNEKKAVKKKRSGSHFGLPPAKYQEMMDITRIKLSKLSEYDLKISRDKRDLRRHVLLNNIRKKNYH